ncbi:MAG: hypothetical protein DI630_25560 [Gordonia sp. (in: high G+C Gram-positive bacteria)]|nr:MAG: hypothetical protein DI630_25560 [Gordonia sp. (in: high G+C Gram-positive bacteria)]
MASTKDCTISFFQLVVAPDNEPIAAVRWKRTFRQLHNRTNCGRTGVHVCQYNGDELDGLVPEVVGRPTLSLAVGRLITPRQRDKSTSARSALPVDSNHEPVEETFVVFFSNNVIGIVRSSLSAPSHAAVAAWLTRVAPPPASAGVAAQWVAKPVIDPEKYQAILNATSISAAEFALKPEQVSIDSGIVHSLINGATGMSDGLRIEVRLTARRGRPGERARDDIRDLATELVSLHEEGEALDKAKVTIKELGESASEQIDLMNHRITTSVPITVNSDRSLDEPSVISSIRVAYSDLRERIAASIVTVET